MTNLIACLLAAALVGKAPTPKHKKPAPPKVRDTITIVAAGHLVMGTDFPDEHPMLPPGFGAPLAEQLAPLFVDADVALANLAAPLTTRKDPVPWPDMKNTFAFRTPPDMGENLKTMGLDVVLAANNHALDFGVAGHHESMHHLDELGIGHVGHVGEVWRTTIRGTRVVVVGFTQPYIKTFQSMRDPAAAAAVVAEAREDADIVIALVHGGGEGRDALHVPDGREYVGHEARGRVIETAHALVDAGADLVLGFGAHAPRAMETYKGRLIDYALGNFYTYGPFDIQSPNNLSLTLRITLDAKTGKLREARIVPLRLRHPGYPESDPQGKVISWLQRYSKADFPDTAPDIDDGGRVTLRADDVTAAQVLGAGAARAAGGPLTVAAERPRTDAGAGPKKEVTASKRRTPAPCSRGSAGSSSTGRAPCRAAP